MGSASWLNFLSKSKERERGHPQCGTIGKRFCSSNMVDFAAVLQRMTLFCQARVILHMILIVLNKRKFVNSIG